MRCCFVSQCVNYTSYMCTVYYKRNWVEMKKYGQSYFGNGKEILIPVSLAGFALGLRHVLLSEHI